MIVCLNCGKENQDHYKFCLGCGAKLPTPGATAAPPRPAAPAPATPRPPIRKPAPRTVVAPPRQRPQPTVPTPPSLRQPTPPASLAPTAPPLPSPAPAAPAPAAPLVPPPVAGDTPVGNTPTSRPPAAASPAEAAQEQICGSCGTANPAKFRFCGNCGSPLAAAAPAQSAQSAQSAHPAPSAHLAPSAQPAPKTPVAPPAPKHRARLTVIRIDGSEGGSIDLEGGPIAFGRNYGPPFDADFYLSPSHCALTVTEGGLMIDRITGANGVYRKLIGRTELEHGDVFRVGQELLHYEDLPEPAGEADGTERIGSPNPGYWGRVSVLLADGIPSQALAIDGEEFTIGREKGDLTFPLDGYVSSSHCRILGDDSGVFLEDRGSSNGTYIRLRPGAEVPYGALILAGQQLFRIDRRP